MKTLSKKIKYWFQKRTRGWSDDELWDLNISFFKYINSRFTEFKKQASKTIDLTYHKYDYKGKTYTQLELIDEIIRLSNFFINMYEHDTAVLITEKSLLHDFFTILEKVIPHMGWRE